MDNKLSTKKPSYCFPQGSNFRSQCQLGLLIGSSNQFNNNNDYWFILKYYVLVLGLSQCDSKKKKKKWYKKHRYCQFYCPPGWNQNKNIQKSWDINTNSCFPVWNFEWMNQSIRKNRFKILAIFSISLCYYSLLNSFSTGFKYLFIFSQHGTGLLWTIILLRLWFAAWLCFVGFTLGTQYKDGN